MRSSRDTTAPRRRARATSTCITRGSMICEPVSVTISRVDGRTSIAPSEKAASFARLTIIPGSSALHRHFVGNS